MSLNYTELPGIQEIAENRRQLHFLSRFSAGTTILPKQSITNGQKQLAFTSSGCWLPSSTFKGLQEALESYPPTHT